MTRHATPSEPMSSTSLDRIAPVGIVVVVGATVVVVVVVVVVAVVAGATVVVVGSATVGAATSVEEQATPSSEQAARIEVTAGIRFTSVPSGVDPGDSLARLVACHPQGGR